MVGLREITKKVWRFKLPSKQIYAALFVITLFWCSFSPALAQQSIDGGQISITGADLAVFENGIPSFNGWVQAFNMTGYYHNSNRMTGIDVFLNGTNLGSPPDGCCFDVDPGQQWSVFWAAIPFVLTVGDTYSIAVVASFSDGTRAYAFAEVGAAICRSLFACPVAGASSFKSTPGFVVLSSGTDAETTITVFQPTSCSSTSENQVSYLTAGDLKDDSAPECLAQEYVAHSAHPIEGDLLCRIRPSPVRIGTGPVAVPTTLSAVGSTFPDNYTRLPSWADAASTCTLAGSGKMTLASDANYYTAVELDPNTPTWLTYQCSTSWNYVNSSFSDNVFSMDVSGADTGLSTALSAVKGAGSIGPLLDFATNLYSLLSLQAVMSAHFFLGYPSTVAALYIDHPNVTASAPGEKWTALGWWLGATLGSAAVTAGLDVAFAITGLSCIATAVGCLAVIAIGLGQFIGGQILNSWCQSQVSDPSPDYAQLLPPPSVPTSLLQVGNRTGATLLVAEYEYISYMNASIESNARSRAAVLANSKPFAYLQEVRASQYAENASLYYSESMQLMRQALVQLNDTGDVNQVSFRSGESLLSSSTFPSNVTAFVRQLGLPSSVLSPENSQAQYVPLFTTLSGLSPDDNPTIALWEGDRAASLELSSSSTNVTTASSGAAPTSSIGSQSSTSTTGFPVTSTSKGGLPGFQNQFLLGAILILVLAVACIAADAKRRSPGFDRNIEARK